MYVKNFWRFCMTSTPSSVASHQADLLHGTRAELLAALDASADGLTSPEATRRLAQNGPNESAPTQRRIGIMQLGSFLTNPLVIILLISSLITGILGDVVDASIIVILVILSVILNFVQAYRSQQAADRLRAQVAPTATVRRDGAWRELPRRELVPGDIIRLRAGDLVPADVRLLKARDLHVQQAALTGESVPVEKEAAGNAAPVPSPAEAHNVALLGTSVVSGVATALVVATGSRTAFGDIVVRLAAKAPETEFDRGLRGFSFLIMRTVLFLVLFVVVVNLAFHRSALVSLLFAVSLAVGLTPEFLPMITTITLGQGALRMARQKVIVKHLAAMQNFGSMDILCSDKTGTLTTGELILDRAVDPLGHPSDQVTLLAYVNSMFETGIQSPLDVAILRHTHPDVASYQKLDEIPFDFERRRSSIVVSSDDQRLLIAKGAPESVLPVCTHYEVAGKVQELATTARAMCETTYQALSAQGYRTLAVAYRNAPAQGAYHVADEVGLTLSGFLAFIDPPVEGVADVLDALRRDGEQVGLDAGRIVLGDELNEMSDVALQHVAETSSVFARVSPAQKNRIMLALKARKHVVGFLGDGINDAPSLHVADVGISVATAVDVAKDAAEIILLERSLAVLHRGVLEGRKAFGNVMKFLLMGTSSSFGNMFSMAGASLFLPFLPMLPTQILLLNFMYDVSQVTIPTDNVDETFIVKPHRWDIGLIRDFMIFIGPISSIYDFLTFFVMLAVFHAGQATFHTGWFVESLATQTLVLFVIRTSGNPFRSRPSRSLTTAVLLIVVGGVLLPYIPFLAGPLGLTPLSPLFFLYLIAATGTYLLLVEMGKRVLMRRRAY